MRRWTEEEDFILFEHMNDGADGVAKAIYRELGFKRSTNAVRCRASDLGLSLARYSTCPYCGRPVPYGKLCRTTGFCRLCNERVYAERSRERRIEAEGSYREWEEEEIASLSRDRARERKRIQEAKRRSGEK